MLKNLILTFVEKNYFVQRLYINIINKIRGNKGDLDLGGVHIRNNKIELSGEKNHVSCKKMIQLYNTRIILMGLFNTLEIGENVQIAGEQPKFYIDGKDNRIVVEDNCCMIDTSFFIKGSHNTIHIGKNCSSIYTEFHIEQDNNVLLIGNGTTMHGRAYRYVQFALDEGTTIKIGEDCMISKDVHFRSSDSHSIVDMDGKRLNQGENIEVGNHCWFGLKSIILKGTEIADNSIIAAGTVCVKKFSERNVIIAGNPGHIVKKDVNWERKFIEN